MTESSLRIGVIGTGRIASSRLVPALGQVSGASFWSVLSRDLGKATGFAQQHKAASAQPAFDSLESFLADPQLQAVIIASPDKLHVEHALACAKAGKHILVEKPFTTNREDGVRVIEACRQNGVKLGVAMHLRWHSGHRLLHKAVTRDSSLGTLRHIRAQWTWRAPDNSNWRAHEELGRWWSLAGTGPHCLDIIRWFAEAGHGQAAQRSRLIAHDVWRGPHDETAIVALQFENGITAEAVTSVLFNAPSKFELYGSDGYAICENTLTTEGRGTIAIGDHPLAFAPGDPYAGEIADFVDAVAHNRAPEVTGEAGLAVVEDLLYAVAS